MKAILIINMSLSCGLCYFGHMIDNNTSMCLQNPIGEIINNKRPSWCPLKFFPEKKINYEKCDCSQGDGFADGWNACLEEIMRG